MKYEVWAGLDRRTKQLILTTSHITQMKKVATRPTQKTKDHRGIKSVNKTLCN